MQGDATTLLMWHEHSSKLLILLIYRSFCKLAADVNVETHDWKIDETGSYVTRSLCQMSILKFTEPKHVFVAT